MYLTSKELAARFRMHPNTVRRILVEMKEIPEYSGAILQPGGGKMWVSEAAFEHYSANRRRIKKGVYYEKFSEKNQEERGRHDHGHGGDSGNRSAGDGGSTGA